MPEIFEWIGVVLLIMLSIVSGYKIIQQKELSKNLIILFIVTIMSTLILFGMRPVVLDFLGVETEWVLLNYKNAVVEIEPKEPKYWSKDQHYTFKWYNAPYGLAIDLGTMNMKNINDRGVTYQLLFIEGNDPAGQDEFKKRFKRMKEFLLFMEERGTDVRKSIEVRILKNERFPSISFYLFTKKKKDVANFYIAPLINESGKACKAFQTYNESVVNFLDAEFSESWEAAEIIPLDTIL